MPGSGTSEQLTVDSAASVFEGLLSREEKETAPETPPAPEAKQPEEEPEPDEIEESEQPDPDAESEEVEDEEQDEPAPQPRKLKVKDNGQELEVTEEEAAAGYSRTQDYTRKSMKLADERRAFEAEATSVRAERQRYAETLANLEAAVQSYGPTEPDWDKLRNEAPDDFAAVWAGWQQHEKKLNAIRAQKEQAQAAVQADNAEKFHGHLQSQQQLLNEAIPAWKDADVAKKEKAELVDFGVSLGFSPDELHQVADHRAIVLLRKAMLFDRAQKKLPAVQEKIAKVKAATPGPVTNRPAVSKTTRALQRLAKTGREQDAADVFERMLDEEETG
jgi:hypothetical protein